MLDLSSTILLISSIIKLSNAHKFEIKSGQLKDTMIQEVMDKRFNNWQIIEIILSSIYRIYQFALLLLPLCDEVGCQQL